MQISYSMTMRNNHYCVSSEHKCDKSCYIYYFLLSSRPLLPAYLPERAALCEHLFYFSFSVCFFFFSPRLPPNGRPPVGLRARAALTTARAALPPTQEREWLDIYQRCKAVIHFFSFFSAMARLEHSQLKGPTLGPTGTPSC